ERAQAARAVGLEGKVFRVRFMKALPPVGEGMAAVHGERIELEPLAARPVVGMAAFIPRRGKAEECGPGAERRVVTFGERGKGERLRLGKVFPAFPRPEPA